MYAVQQDGDLFEVEGGIFDRYGPGTRSVRAGVRAGARAGAAEQDCGGGSRLPGPRGRAGEAAADLVALISAVVRCFREISFPRGHRPASVPSPQGTVVTVRVSGVGDLVNLVIAG